MRHHLFRRLLRDLLAQLRRAHHRKQSQKLQTQICLALDEPIGSLVFTVVQFRLVGPEQPAPANEKKRNVITKSLKLHSPKEYINFFLISLLAKKIRFC